MKFYTYNQNNSGGSFTFDEQAGITHYVIVQAEDLDFAKFRAEKIGLYFNGCSSGRDCSCCGDRWYQPWSDDGTDSPEIYGSPVEKTEKPYFGFDVGKQICVHYVDGRKEWF